MVDEKAKMEHSTIESPNVSPYKITVTFSQDRLVNDYPLHRGWTFLGHSEGAQLG